MNGDLNHNKSYSAEELRQYLAGTLSGARMHAIEKAALDDPLLADAIEGLRELNPEKNSRDFASDVNELKRRLSQRVNSRAKVVALGYNTYWWRIAAIIILFGAGLTLYNYIRKNSAKPLVAKTANESAGGATAPAGAIQPPLEKKTSDSSGAFSEPANVSAAAGKKLHSAGKEQSSSGLNRKQKPEAEAVPPATVADQAPAVAKAETPRADRLKEKDSRASMPSPSASGLSQEFQPASVPALRYAFRGTVVNEKNQPLPGVTISLQDHALATRTDARGNFKMVIRDHDSPMVAKIHSDGYQAELITLSDEVKNSNNIVILREAKDTGLQDIVVTGYAAMNRNANPRYDSLSSGNPDVKPSDGWPAFYRDLEKRAGSAADSLGLHGEVILQFVVGENGELSGFTFSKSTGSLLDQQAIDLIRQGPSWKLLRGKHSTVTVRVLF
jgi:outer membrane biosynthesis protein TonB